MPQVQKEIKARGPRDSKKLRLRKRAVEIIERFFLAMERAYSALLRVKMTPQLASTRQLPWRVVVGSHFTHVLVENVTALRSAYDPGKF
ncbi:hypothetical protein EVAR_67065_1 [Eumeta japonica]|uniref:Uncharacterized protein n=1 Tax=Eumeta variegata TaxID=151549 RepID=A0A4C1ZJB3_EUMVA|nr:hypothetical protein EVAR_67065_1 [Eumeta japonica]